MPQSRARKRAEGLHVFALHAANALKTSDRETCTGLLRAAKAFADVLFFPVVASEIAVRGQVPTPEMHAGTETDWLTCLHAMHAAKAVAGEADVPFFSISASEFVELYVGMGAMRVCASCSRPRAERRPPSCSSTRSTPSPRVRATGRPGNFYVMPFTSLIDFACTFCKVSSPC